jgi:Brp/Blh family beta-carotene 15,15'-monooxygenase
MESIKKKYKLISITVILSIALVAWQLLVGPLVYKFQVLFFITTILIFGIPHGALDRIVDQEVARRRKTSFQKLTFSVKYIGAIAAYALLWHLFPQVSLVAFLLMSSWHFGETDFQLIKNKTLLSVFSRIVYGMSILLWIISTHTTEASVTIFQLIPAASALLKVWLVVVENNQLIIAGAACIIVAALLINQLGNWSKFSLKVIFQLIIILTSCYFLPLLPAFALYFVGWHSLITLYNIEEFINTGTPTTKRFSVMSLCLKALPASLMAIGALLLTGLLFRYNAPIFNPLPLLFVFLSLITLPHVQVMHKLNL